MLRVLENILEELIRYTFLGVIIALLIMLILLVLLHARDRVRAYLNIAFISDKFEELCQLSDRLDENHDAQGPFGGTVWLYRLILKSFMVAGGLMILWIIVMTLKR
jgi:hypothetical protein